ncbi:AzlC family ABC transporter permease [Leuconostoc miyukkimchii]|uniref:AzlC family ABC transporter permease n=1 Tax=Leuconostoc miyukkimchii TaxID=910540 RepID=UPI001C7D2FBE|nr:AzlC family ABC transporter permease [Leuconostoc miyukkimchii]
MTISKIQLQEFMSGVKASLPTMLGYISIGAAFGTIAGSAGFSVWYVFLLSSVFYAGSAQFIVVNMLAANASISSIVLMVLLVNFRMFLQSLTVTQVFPNQSRFSSLLMGGLVTDESFGILSISKMADKKTSVPWMHGLNIASWFIWWLSCTSFAIIGKQITNPADYGLDFALTGMFAGLWLLTSVSMLEHPNEKKTEIVGIVIVTTVLLYLFMYFFSSVVAVLLASVLGSLISIYIVERRKK